MHACDGWAQLVFSFLVPGYTSSRLLSVILLWSPSSVCRAEAIWQCRTSLSGHFLGQNKTLNCLGLHSPNEEGRLRGVCITLLLEWVQRLTSGQSFMETKHTYLHIELYRILNTWDPQADDKHVIDCRKKILMTTFEPQKQNKF